jgi:type I restriction enzyme M protein
MNLAIRGIDARLELGDTLLNDKHPDLKADYVMVNPPFNVSDWSGEQLRDDVRWKEYGAPPVGNANYAWLLHFLHKLSTNGTAGIVLANGSMNSNTGGEGEIRQKMIEAGVVDCMVALPSQLFYNTMIPACLWFLRRGRGRGEASAAGSLNNEHASPADASPLLFIDARNMGQMVSRRNRELTDADIARIADTYHAWRSCGGEASASEMSRLPNTLAADASPLPPYTDIPGFCKSATIDEIRANGYVLMPGRYVGTEEEEDDGIPFEEKMTALTKQLAAQFAKGAELEATIRKNLEGMGYEL